MGPDSKFVERRQGLQRIRAYSVYLFAVMRSRATQQYARSGTYSRSGGPRGAKGGLGGGVQLPHQKMITLSLGDMEYGSVPENNILQAVLISHELGG